MKPGNVGSVLRAAFCYDAALVAIQGDRTQIKESADTPQAWQHIPVLRAVDLVEGASSLPDFEHPRRAFYVFGPEDGTLGRDVLAWCPQRVMVPTRMCMNLAATVNVVLYDRLAKESRAVEIAGERRAA